MMMKTQRWRRLTTVRLVRSHSLQTGTLRNDFFQSPYEFFCERDFSNLGRDREISSYKERLRSGLVGIKKDDAVALFKGVKLDVKTYNIMIGGLCKKGLLSEAGQLFRKMGEDGVAPSSGTYNTLIRAHLRVSDISNSAKLIEEMKSCGFSSDASTVKIVMHMLSSGDLDKSFLNMLSGPFGDK